jgi:beta-galactosidase
MRKQFTRRGLLKTGIAASAGLIGSNGLAFGSLEAGAAALANEGSSQLPETGVAVQHSPRQRLLLDFGWRFHLGDANDAMKDFRYGAPTREGTFAKAGQNWLHNPKDGSLQHSFDDSAWRVVDLPHDWAVELPFEAINGPDGSVHAAHGGKALGREYPATSIGWYQRTFEIPASDEGLRISIEFDGVFRDSIVLFNGFYIGRNLSGYAPFSFDVTDYVKYGGSNVVTVRVDATLNEGWYYEGAGIYRHTWLVKTNPLHVAQWGTWVRSDVRGKGARIVIETELLNESDTAAHGRLASRILGPDGTLVATVPPRPFEIPAWGSLTVASQGFVAEAKLWSVEEPQLYKVATQVESGGRIADEHGTAFGIRSIGYDADRGFFLNGQSVKIKGTCSHQDHAGVGIGVPDRMHYDRVALLRQMGSNGWRTAHNPVATEVLDACDRLGMMVMAETRIMASTPEGLSELERMVKRDRNHPSIVIWSLANEEYFYQGTPTGARIIASMKRATKKLDPTRPVTGAMNGSWGRGMSNVVDVQGFNYFNGAPPDEKPKPGRPQAADIDNFHTQFPKLPTIGTEMANGKSARGIYETDPKRGYVTAYEAGCSDCKTPAETWWTIFDERPFLSGGFTWAGFDYRGEPTPYDHVAIGSQSGILDMCGFPKDIYFYYKSWWRNEPVLHLFPHWNWSGQEGRNIDVRCYSNLDSVELFLNGESLGSKPVKRNSHVYWTVQFRPGTLEARGTKNGTVTLTERRETTGAPTRLVVRPNQTAIVADGEDVSSVTVEVQDAQGSIVPTASNHISFTVSGAGKIIGVGNGDPSCHEADQPSSSQAASRSAFSGLCMVFIQSTKKPGPIELQVFAEDIGTSRVTIQSVAGQPKPSVG